jgi:hypothetical protein
VWWALLVTAGDVILGAITTQPIEMEADDEGCPH